MFRGLIPLVKSGSKFLAPHLLSAANNILNDTSLENKSFEKSLKHHGLNLISNVANEMNGGNYHIAKKRRRVNSAKNSSKKRKVSRNKKKKSVIRKSSKSKGGKKSVKRTTKLFLD
jgi:hypothetical protein